MNRKSISSSYNLSSLLIRFVEFGLSAAPAFPADSAYLPPNDSDQILWSMLCMWSDSFMVLRPFWIRLCVRRFKTRTSSSTSNGRQSPYNNAPVATGSSTTSSGLSSRIAITVAASAWNGCAVVSRQHRSYRGGTKTAAPRCKIRRGVRPLRWRPAGARVGPGAAAATAANDAAGRRLRGDLCGPPLHHKL